MTPPDEPEKHEEFWFDDGDLVLLASPLGQIAVASV